MDIENISGISLRNLGNMNVLLGKNGCGKSYLLRQIEQALRGRQEFGVVKYFSPERGGVPKYEANIEQNVSANPNWLADTRRYNQAAQFRQQSAAQFRMLETLFLREIEKTPELRADTRVSFDTTVDRINTLLDRVQIKRAGPAFRILESQTHNEVQPEQISSGESELISLSIECLMFKRECHPERTNLLLIDEPDVHLHPDLQARLAEFIGALTQTTPLTLLIATHSTALLGAMSEGYDTHVAFMRYGDTEIRFSPVADTHRKVLPVFGAHPLSNVFNQAPVLLLEGEDDERIWQQATRSSQGRIRVYPCSVDGVVQLTVFERETAKIIEAVYDNAVGYSIRDRDNSPSEIDDLGPIKRMRLACRSAENLILTDEVLESLAVQWDDLVGRIEAWLISNPQHPHFEQMHAFAKNGFGRRDSDLKVIRNDLVGLLGTNRPWEVIVGQAIAAIAGQQPSDNPNSLSSFLGPKVLQVLLAPK